MAIPTDFADFLAGTTGNDTIFALGGADSIFGLAGNDNLYGGNGDDLIDAGLGLDFAAGGEGSDYISYLSSASGVFVDLAAREGYREGQRATDLDVFVSIENAIGSNSSDRLIGDGGANIIDAKEGFDEVSGGGGNDTLYGRAGDDTLTGGAGADVINGGAGFDMARYGGSTAGVTVNLATGAGLGGDAEGDTLSEVENIYGSSFRDILTGGDGFNHLWGNAGNDSLQGLDGNDLLEGSLGNDKLAGGNGDDTLAGNEGADAHNGGAGNDWAVYTQSAAGVTLSLTANTASGGDAEGDSFFSIENVVGSNHDDVITGSSAANYIEAGNGNDRLYGQAGIDTLIGSEGNDALNGGSGNDVIGGGAGRDVMTGGTDADRFVFDFAADSGMTATTRDIIKDFAQGADQIDLGNILSGIPFDFVGAGDFELGTGPAVRFFTAGAKTIVEADTNGDQAGDMQIELTGVFNLTAADFIL